MLVTFHSVSAALYLQKLLTARGEECHIIPVPRALSSSCGYAAEIAHMQADALFPIFTEFSIEWEAIYRPAPHGKYTLLAAED